MEDNLVKLTQDDINGMLDGLEAYALVDRPTAKKIFEEQIRPNLTQQDLHRFRTNPDGYFYDLTHDNEEYNWQ